MTRTSYGASTSGFHQEVKLTIFDFAVIARQGFHLARPFACRMAILERAVVDVGLPSWFHFGRSKLLVWTFLVQLLHSQLMGILLAVNGKQQTGTGDMTTPQILFDDSNPGQDHGTAYTERCAYFKPPHSDYFGLKFRSRVVFSILKH